MNSWRRALCVSGLGFVIVCSTASYRCGEADPVAAKPSCTASVKVAGYSKACPTAPIRIHISVAGCARSTGTFKYDYMVVDESTKSVVGGAGSWKSSRREWDQTERVPLACDAEIHEAQHERVTSCQCQ